MYERVHECAAACALLAQPPKGDSAADKAAAGAGRQMLRTLPAVREVWAGFFRACADKARPSQQKAHFVFSRLGLCESCTPFTP